MLYRVLFEEKRKGKKENSVDRDKISVGKRSEGQKAHCLKRKRSDSGEPCVWASVQGSDKKKKREEKKNWCPRAWPYEYGRLSKMATSPAGLDASRIHVVRRIVESSRVGGGFTAAQSTGVCYPSPRGVPTPGWNTSLSPIRRFFSFLPLSLIPLSS